MPLAPGTRIGPYEVATPIGAGGMGEVYRAKDTTLGREVAVKVLPTAFAQDQDRVARFRREAQVLASVSHPNIASIHGLEETSGAVALALELVEGEDLQQRLRRGPIPVEEAMAIARQIAQGLEAAHEKGIVHRDLKPANVKVTPEGEVKLLDFGLARAYEVEAASTGRTLDLSHSPALSNMATEAGIVLGTAGYMSPEQARGKTVDKRADIWSFGVVMFEMLSGRRLFQGETASDTLTAVIRQEIDWRLLPSHLPPADRRLIERCLERDPQERLRDIGEARIALSRRDRGGEPVARETRRDVLRLATAAVAGLAGGIGLMSLGPRRSGQARGDGLRLTPLTSSGNVVSVSISPDGNLIAYVESDQGLESLWLQQIASGQTLRLVRERAVAYWSHVFTPDGNAVIFGERSQADPGGALYSISALGGTPRRLISGMDSPPTFSPDGKRMAYTRLAFPGADQTALMVASIDGVDPKPLAIVNRPERIAGLFYGGPTWSPDGRSIVTAVARSGREEHDAQAWLVAVSVADGALKRIADPGWSVANQAAFLPDGRSLVVIARSVEQSDNQIWRVSLPGGEARRVTTDLNDHRIVSLTRDGQGLATVAEDVSCTISTVPAKPSAPSRRIGRGRNDGLNGIGFGPRGQAIYTAFNDGRWSLWSADVDGGDRRKLFTADPAETLAAPSTTPSGTTYFFSRSPSGGRLRALDAGASTPRTVCAAIGVGAASRDGRFIVYPNGPGAGRLFRRDLPNGEERLLIDLPAILPSIDPEGRRVAFYYNTPEGPFRFGVCPAAGGPLLIDLPAEPISTTASRLVIRGDALYVNTVQGDRANVWRVPLSGGSPVRITAFTEQVLFDFALPDDFERDSLILVARGRRLRDAQLITGF
jgi:Tol biopolymer transport system component/tRNA A-37 threonylcarbamoyl transferase component Bud32